MKLLFNRLCKLLKPSFISWFLVVIIFAFPAFIFTTYLYSLPTKSVIINISDTSKNEYFVYSSSDVSDNFTETFFSKVFQTSLSLDWYDVCLVNRNKFFVNGIESDSTTLLKDDPEAGALELNLISGELHATSTFYTKLNTKICKTLSLGSKPMILLQNLSFRRPEKFKALVEITTKDNNVNLGPIEMTIDMVNSYGYIQNNILAWTLKFLAILGLWSAFVLFLKKLLKFVNNSK